MYLLQKKFRWASLAIAASLSVGLLNQFAFASKVPSAPKQIQVQGANLQQKELGVWEVEVDVDRGQTLIRQISGEKGVKVSSLIGVGANTLSQAQTGGTVFNNNPLLSIGSPGPIVANYASASYQFTITNNTGSTLGQSSATGVTGVRLLLVPYSATDCPAGVATTLSRPICVVSNTSTLATGTGASGNVPSIAPLFNPVYMSYMTDRTGANLSSAEDTTAPELNEATSIGSSADPTFRDAARTVWQPTLTIANGASATFGIRMRYAQDTPGNGQPNKVNRFLYRFRLLADRTNAAVPTSANAFVTTVVGFGIFSSSNTGGNANGVGQQARLNLYSVASSSIQQAGLDINPNGRTLYAADLNNNRIVAIDLATNTLSTLASNPTGITTLTADSILNPVDVAVDAPANRLYFAERNPGVIGANAVKYINLTDNSVNVFTALPPLPIANGVTGPAVTTTLSGIALGSSSGGAQYLYASVRTGGFIGIRVYNRADGSLVSSLNTNGTAVPADVVEFNNALYVADRNGTAANASIVRFPLTRDANGFPTGLGTPTRVGGTGSVFLNPMGLAISQSNGVNTLYVAEQGNSTNPGRVTSLPLNADGTFPNPLPTASSPVVVPPAGTAGSFLFAEGIAANARFSITQTITNPTTGVVTNGATGGLGGIAISPSGSILYVSDSANQRIRQIQAIEGAAP